MPPVTPEAYEVAKAAIDLALVLQGSHIPPWPMGEGGVVPSRLATWLGKLDAIRDRIINPPRR